VAPQRRTWPDAACAGHHPRLQDEARARPGLGYHVAEPDHGRGADQELMVTLLQPGDQDPVHGGEAIGPVLAEQRAELRRHPG
jgi:hypothetical protein